MKLNLKSELKSPPDTPNSGPLHPYFTSEKASNIAQDSQKRTLSISLGSPSLRSLSPTSVSRPRTRARRLAAHTAHLISCDSSTSTHCETSSISCKHPEVKADGEGRDAAGDGRATVEPAIEMPGCEYPNGSPTRHVVPGRVGMPNCFGKAKS